MADISIQINGLEKVQAGLEGLNGDLRKTMIYASREVSAEILQTEGLQKYPGATAANMPPAPYYKRGSGTIYKGGGSSGSSENLGKQWTTKTNPGDNSFTIGNRASYAPYVHGDEQAKVMDAIGWRKLAEVAEEKIDAIQKIIQGWIDRLIVKAGL